MRKFFLPAVIFLLVLFSGCAEYAATDWQNVFQKQSGQKVELEGYIGGTLTYPTQIFQEGELQGYLLNAPWGKQTTGIPLILKQQIDCASNHVKVKGEIVKRGVQPMGTNFIELLDWILLKVNSVECLEK